MELGKQIRRYRNERSFSQETLAEKVYVSRQTISNWENGKSYPDVNSLVLLSEAFEVSLDKLIKGDVENMKEQINRRRSADLQLPECHLYGATSGGGCHAFAVGGVFILCRSGDMVGPFRRGTLCRETCGEEKERDGCSDL